MQNIKSNITKLNHTQKSSLRETPNLLTNAERNTNSCLLKRRKKSINPERLLVFKALQVGPQMHQSTSQKPPTHGPSTGAIWNISLFLRLYVVVDECTSPLVKHLLRMEDPCILRFIFLCKK